MRGPVLFQLKRVERAEVHVGDPPGQALAGLAQQLDRRRPEDEKTPGASSAAATLIDESAQRLEDLRHAVDLIEDDQAVFVGAQEQRRVAELRAVLARFEVQVECVRTLGHCESEGRLADLPGPQQGHGSLAVQGVLNGCQCAAWNHPCILNTPCLICKDETEATDPEPARILTNTHLTHYHGVFAPHSRCRAEVIPAGRG